MDETTRLALAVDSTQVSAADRALAQMAATGARAETAAAALTATATQQGRTLAGQLVPAATKAAGAVGQLAVAERAAADAPADTAAAAAFTATATGARDASAAVKALATATDAVGAPAGLAAAVGDLKQLQAAADQAATATTRAAEKQRAAAERVAQATAAQAVAAKNAADAQRALDAAPTRAAPGQGIAAITALEDASKRAATAQGLLDVETRRLATAQAALQTATARAASAQDAQDQAAQRLVAAQTQIQAAYRLTAAAAQAAASAQGAAATAGSAPAPGGAVPGAPRPLPTPAPAPGGGNGPIPAGVVPAAAAATGAVDKYGRTVKQLAQQHQIAAVQVKDFFEQVVSGGSPLRALAQQGAAVVSNYGGVERTLSSLGALISPVTVGIAAAAAAVGVLAFAFYKGAADSERFANAIQLSGNYAGKTEGQITSLARAVAASSGEAVGNVREIAAALLQTGQVGPQVFGQATAAATGYANATGKTAQQVAQEFARMSEAPAKFAAEANKSLNFISAAQYAAIKAFEEGGRAADAQGVIYDALIQRFGRVDQNLGTIERALNATKSAWSRFWDAAFDIGRRETIEQKVASTAAKIQALQSAPIGDTARQLQQASGGGPTPVVARLQQEQTGNYRKLLRETENATAESLRAETQKQAIAADSVVEAYLKRGKAASTYAEKLAQLNRSIQAKADAGVPLSAADQAVARAELKKEFTPTPGRKGRVDHEPEQIRRETLAADLKVFQDALQKERDELTFHNRFLQGEYQAGRTSLGTYYEERRATIAAGVKAEIAELEKEKARVQKDADAVAKTDPSEAVKLRSKVTELSAQQEKIQREAANEATLSVQQQEAAYKSLADQVLAYRANLLQLQGDEVGAAKLRAQAQAEQSAILARQSAGTPSAITAAQLEQEQRATNQAIAYQQTQVETSRITERLQIQEERVSLARQTGAIGDTAAQRAIGKARADAVAQLEAIVAAEEAVAKASGNPALILNAERARLELEKLRAVVDPLAKAFDDTFRQAGGSAIEDFLNGTKTATQAVRGFLSTVAGSIIHQTAEGATQKVFGKGGALEGAGAFVSEKLFGGPTAAERAAPKALDTGAVQTSLGILRTAGIDPAATALGGLAAAADRAAAAVGAQRPGGEPAIGQPEPVQLRTTGDLARFDRAAEAGGAGAPDRADADKAAADGATKLGTAATSAAEAAVQLASAAQRGGGALQLLPTIIRMVETAASVSSTASSGGSGGWLGSILSAAASAYSGGGGDYGITNASTGSLVSNGLGAGRAVGGPVGARALHPVNEKGPELYTDASGRQYLMTGPAGGHVTTNTALVDAAQKAGVPQLGPFLPGVAGRRGAQGVAAVAGRAVAAGRAAGALVSLAADLAPAPVGNRSSRVEALRELRLAGGREIGGPVAPGQLYRVNERRERRPELLKMAGKQYLLAGDRGGEVKPAPPAPAGGAKTLHLHYYPTPGESRETTMQRAATAGRAARMALARSD